MRKLTVLFLLLVLLPAMAATYYAKITDGYVVDVVTSPHAGYVSVGNSIPSNVMCGCYTWNASDGFVLDQDKHDTWEVEANATPPWRM